MMNDQPKTRASLILRLRHSDDGAAWQEFIEIYQPLVYRLARKSGLQEADALDTTQEVLARVAKSVNRWDPDDSKGSFRGWLSRITRNLVVDFLRSRQRVPITSDHSSIGKLLRSIPASDPVEAEFEAEHQRQVFAWAVERIRDTFQKKSWQAFWMTAVEHRDVASVATELELTKGAVYIARSRVMSKLKQQIQKYLQVENSLKTKGAGDE